MKTPSKTVRSACLFIVALFLLSVTGIAGNDGAILKLVLNKTDSLKTCKAILTANDKPASGVTVKFYVRRMFSLLPIGKPVTTDDQGAASVKFPKNLPGGSDGKVVIIAKLDDDPVFGNLQAQDSVKWGSIVPAGDGNWEDRSLAASRSRAPMFLIVASNVIIVGIWGTLFYIVFQLFRLRNISRKPRTQVNQHK
ncbi:MAG: hypothetical protein ACHQRM_12170 [Bacteroidia bacterium]